MKKHRVLCAIVLIAVLFLTGCNETDIDYVPVVQNGYLGEYTDITVKDLFGGHYGLLYDEETWGGGPTDSGKEIVEIKYHDSNNFLDDVTIQFTMLSENSFKVTAFVDPLETIDKASDLLAVLNYFYFEQYILKNEDIVGDFDAEFAFIERLDQISASVVQYGASSDYSGDRSQLCALLGDTPIDFGVPWLLDEYGLLDMEYYYSANDEASKNTSTNGSTNTPANDADNAQEGEHTTRTNEDLISGEPTEDMSLARNPNGILYSLFNLYIYEGSYSTESITISLTVTPDETAFYCTLFWTYGRMEEYGIVRPGVKTELSEGTYMTLDLNENGSINVILEGESLPNTYSMILWQ